MSNETKDTPGPWHIQPLDVVNVLGSDNLLICSVLTPDRPIAEDAANGRLIAAAPKLLKQLKICHAALVWHPGGDDRSEEDIAETEAVIAKAEGR